MYLLDTNVVSELRKGTRADAGVSAWIASIDDRELYLSVLVLGEIRQGVERLRLRDPAGAARLDRWLGDLADHHAARLLSVDAHVAELWGRMNLPDPVPAIDGLLAATAIVHDLTLVTRDLRDVERCGARLFNPFSG